jgi:hypothetical protein
MKWGPCFFVRVVFFVLYTSITGPLPVPGPFGGPPPRRISTRAFPVPVMEFSTTETILMTSAPQNADQKVSTEK